MDGLLNVAQAAELAGKSERDLRRYLAREKKEPGRHVPGAIQDEEGRWQIPAETAQSLGKYAPPLTAEEKGLIAALKARDAKTTAKEITRELNRVREARGVKLIKKPAVDKALQKMEDAPKLVGFNLFNVAYRIVSAEDLAEISSKAELSPYLLKLGNGLFFDSLRRVLYGPESKIREWETQMRSQAEGSTP